MARPTVSVPVPGSPDWQQRLAGGDAQGAAEADFGSSPGGAAAGSRRVVRRGAVSLTDALNIVTPQRLAVQDHGAAAGSGRPGTNSTTPSAVSFGFAPGSRNATTTTVIQVGGRRRSQGPGTGSVSGATSVVSAAESKSSDGSGGTGITVTAPTPSATGGGGRHRRRRSTAKLQDVEQAVSRLPRYMRRGSSAAPSAASALGSGRSIVAGTTAVLPETASMLGNGQKSIKSDANNANATRRAAAEGEAEEEVTVDWWSYYMRHPVARIFVATFIIFLNFLIYAEDPIAHSRAESTMPVLGDGVGLLFMRNPSQYVGLILLKISIGVASIVAGMAIGRQIIHKRFLHTRYEMFARDKGTWMIMFMVVLPTLFIGVKCYNFFLAAVITSPVELSKWQIGSGLIISNAAFSKGGAMGTWFGDSITAFMVIDMILQDRRHYQTWARCVRHWWVTGCKGYLRVVAFWVVFLVGTTLVAVNVASPLVDWDALGDKYNIRTTELGRGTIAGLITLSDILILVQDWEFPQFRTDLDINLPGCNWSNVSFTLFRGWSNVRVTGKWFNYGILCVVMVLDLNMCKNMVLYSPSAFGQYVDPDGFIWTVTNATVLQDLPSITYESRLAANQTGDFRLNARYVGWSNWVLLLTAIPTIAGFGIMFATLHMSRYREEEDAEEADADDEEIGDTGDVVEVALPALPEASQSMHRMVSHQSLTRAGSRRTMLPPLQSSSVHGSLSASASGVGAGSHGLDSMELHSVRTVDFSSRYL